MKKPNEPKKDFHPIKDWRERKPIFLILDISLSIITVILFVAFYFLEQKIFLSIAFLCLGLSFFNRGLEYKQKGQRFYFLLNVFIAMFVTNIGVLTFLLY